MFSLITLTLNRPHFYFCDATVDPTCIPIQFQHSLCLVICSGESVQIVILKQKFKVTVKSRRISKTFEDDYPFQLSSDIPHHQSMNPIFPGVVGSPFILQDEHAAEKKGKTVFSREAVETLKLWFAVNSSRPYASEEKKVQLAKETGLSVLQIDQWLTSTRQRNQDHPAPLFE